MTAVRRLWLVRGILTAFVLSLLLGSDVLAQHSRTLADVKALIDAAFPDLLKVVSRVSVTVDASIEHPYDEGPIQVLVNRGPGPTSPDTPFFRGYFWFEGGLLQSVQVDGVYVNAPPVEAVYETAKTHPDWTDADLDAQLIRAGAKFPPSRQTEFRSVLRIDRFMQALGRTTITGTLFRWRLGNPALGANDVISPRWIVSVDSTPAEGPRRCYALLFEPFDGMFRGLVTANCSH